MGAGRNENPLLECVCGPPIRKIATYVGRCRQNVLGRTGFPGCLLVASPARRGDSKREIPRHPRVAAAPYSPCCWVAIILSLYKFEVLGAVYASRKPRTACALHSMGAHCRLPSYDWPPRPLASRAFVWRRNTIVVKLHQELEEALCPRSTAVVNAE